MISMSALWCTQYKLAAAMDDAKLSSRLILQRIDLVNKRPDSVLSYVKLKCYILIVFVIQLFWLHLNLNLKLNVQKPNV